MPANDAQALPTHARQMPTEPRNRIDLKLILLFVLAAYVTYLFHEFGHWSIGEMLGNDMGYSLNYAWARRGHYVHAWQAPIISMGGPAFTILQAALGLVIIERYRTVYAYPFVFFPLFNRFFSLVFGGFSRQDEARISADLHAGRYTVAAIVLALLVLIVVRSSSRLNLSARKNGYLVVLATACQVLVIGTYELLS